MCVGAQVADALKSGCVPDPEPFPCVCWRAGGRCPQVRLHARSRALPMCVGAQVADALKSGCVPDPEPFPCVSLFFSDIIGYTDLCSKLSPHEVMAMLHRLYSRFDAIAQGLEIFKGVPLLLA